MGANSASSALKFIPGEWRERAEEHAKLISFIKEEFRTMMRSRNEYSPIVRHTYKWRAFCGAGSRLFLLSLSPVTLFPFRSREFCVMYGPTHSCPPYHLYVHLHSSLRSVPERRRDRPRAGLRVELRGPRPAQGVSAGSS